MIRHIVWWTLKEEAEGRSAAENAQRLVDASAILQGISSVRAVEVSCSIQPTSTVPAQVVLQSVHDDMAALKSYADDPLHLEFAAKVKAVCASRQALDYAVDQAQ